MIYTFYSYKGGVGRTHLLANLASYLCYYRKRRVLLIDWDLEAPGLHFYFGKTDHDIKSKGLIDLCEHYTLQAEKADAENPLTEKDLLFPNEEYLTSLVTTAHTGKIDLLPATKYEEGYHARVNAFDWIDFYDHKTGNVYLAWLKEQFGKRKYYDYVFIDSRTGQNDYSGICNVLMPDMNILVVAPNIQNFQGAKQMADRILKATYTQENRKDKAFMLPILSKVDNFFGERADEWKGRFVDYFEFTIPIFDDKLKPFNKEVLDIILSKTVLNYNAEFAMGERTYFLLEAPDLKASSYLKNFENIAVEFLEQMNETGEININALVGDEMIPVYLKQIKENPRDYVAHFGLGNAHYGLENYPQAILAYQKAVEIKLDFHEAWNNLGLTYDNLQDYAQAILAYQKAIEIKPDDHEAWYNLGLTYYNLQDYTQAALSYQKAIEIKPDKHEAWYNLGLTYYNLQNYAQATLAYQKAIEIKPDFHEAWYNLGIVYAKLQDYAQAILAYQKAVEIKPDIHDVWYNLGNTYIKLQDYAQAIIAYQKATEIKPDDHDAWYNLACAYSLQKDKTQALAYLKQAIAIEIESGGDAKKDTDFAWLWEDADFKALVD